MMQIPKAVFVISFLSSLVASPAFADNADSTKPRLSHSVPQLQLKRRTVDDKEQMAPEAMLTDIRDTRLSLGQVKQQSVNLFLEATRTLVHPTEPALETSPTTINLSMLNENEHYLPPRKEWLVFYVNSLEPIIHMMADDIYDIDTNGRKVTPVIEEKINPLWITWKEKVLNMQRALDEIQAQIAPDSATNIPLAKAAVSIFESATELEKARYKAAVLLREEYLKEAQAKQQ